MRRRLLLAAIIIPASFYLLFFVNEGLVAFGRDWLHAFKLPIVETTISKAVPVLVALAIGLGLVNLFGLHGGNVARRRTGWSYSIIVFVSFAVVTAALLWQYYVVDEQRLQLNDQTDAAWSKLAAAQRLRAVDERDRALAKLTEEDWAAIRRRQAYEDTYHFQPRQFYADYINIPLVNTVMALLGFYITYAAYRAFRVRSLEATLMMVSAAVVILGSDPVGGWLTSGWLTKAAEFDNTVLNSGMQRGLMLGIHVATIIVCLRMFLGYERGVIDVVQTEE